MFVNSNGVVTYGGFEEKTNINKAIGQIKVKDPYIVGNRRTGKQDEGKESDCLEKCLQMHEHEVGKEDGARERYLSTRKVHLELGSIINGSEDIEDITRILNSSSLCNNLLGSHEI